jgi:nitrogen-specific signal transduction histidine kinase
MGLGLTIARAVLRRHGGLVELECPPDGGTIARCLLPAAREEGEIGGSGV